MNTMDGLEKGRKEVNTQRHMARAVHISKRRVQRKSQQMKGKRNESSAIVVTMDLRERGTWVGVLWLCRRGLNR